MLSLLSNIKALQSPGNKTYPEGIFPSQRLHIPTGIVREDDNSFYTAFIVFTLRRLEKYFSDEELKIVKDIKEQAQKGFQSYKNKKGERTYNFWRSGKNAHFPNGKMFSRFNYFRIPDDADSTTLVYLAKGYTADDIIYLKKKLLYHAKLPVKVSKNMLPHYRNIKLYSTWFGKKMSSEMDVCVASSILYLLFESKAELNEYDNDCIRFVCSMINNDEFKTQVPRVAPFYGKTSIILYHVSRLFTITDHPDIMQLKAKLKSAIVQKLAEEGHPMEKVILNTSLMWLGETENIQELEMPADTNFAWFIAGMLTSANIPFVGWLGSLPFFHIQYYCEACVKTLFIEYKMEKEALLSSPCRRG